MEVIVDRKAEGSKFYKQGLSCGDKNCFAQACQSYGKSIELILQMEESLSNHPGSLQELATLKPTLFMNLGMANYQLLDFQNCIVCCNTAIILCNDTAITLDALGINEDVHDITSVAKPVAPLFVSILTKTLFRRGKALAETGNFTSALIDLEEAHSLSPQDKGIARELKSLRQRTEQMSLECMDKCTVAEAGPMEGHRGSLISDAAMETSVEGQSMTHNGGPCLLRRGRWSQTIQDLTVYIPCDFLSTSITTGSPPPPLEARISPSAVYLRKKGLGEDAWHALSLARRILPDESSWFLLPGSKNREQGESDRGVEGSDKGWMVLVLRKAQLNVEEEYAGSEWWECVFEGDEKIETITCCVGADVSSLPAHAIQRAEREHVRFQTLSALERQKEQESLSGLKEAFAKAHLNTKAAAELEDRSLNVVPERAEMLEALRTEFPNIQFTSK